MERRKFLKSFLSVTACCVVSGVMPSLVYAGGRIAGSGDNYIRDYLNKMRFHDLPHPDDVYLKQGERSLLQSVLLRLGRVQNTVGHGNFYLLSFDQAVKIAHDYNSVQPFSGAELDFMEKIFYRDASQYGFVGSKPLLNLTDSIDRQKVVKGVGAGNYLYKNDAFETYRKIRRDLGSQVVLTSGIRGVVKQFYLFLNKLAASASNLSLASRSLAPPGYSFHSSGDFDVGQADLGSANFTESFTRSKVYRRLVDNGYANLRYGKDNLLGVRFEPWHIKLEDVA